MDRSTDSMVRGIPWGRKREGEEPARGPQQDAEQGPNQEKVAEETKTEMAVETKEEIVPDINEKLVNVIHYSCGELGHYSSGYHRPKSCFICHSVDHVVDKCHEWQKPSSLLTILVVLIEVLVFTTLILSQGEKDLDTGLEWTISEFSPLKKGRLRRKES